MHSVAANPSRAFCHGLQDFARKLLVRYRAGDADCANERTIILRMYSVAAKLVPRFYMYSTMYCSQLVSRLKYGHSYGQV
jgi:hypothetical protein